MLFFGLAVGTFFYHPEIKRSHIKNFVQTDYFRSISYGRTSYNLSYANFSGEWKSSHKISQIIQTFDLGSIKNSHNLLLLISLGDLCKISQIIQTFDFGAVKNSHNLLLIASLGNLRKVFC